EHVAEAVGHEDPPGAVHGDALGAAERRPGGGAGDESERLAVAGPLADPLVPRVGDVKVAAGAERYRGGPLELGEVAAGTPEGAEELAFAAEHLDAGVPLLEDVDAQSLV